MPQYKICHTQDQQGSLATVIENREPTDIVFFYHHHFERYCVGNKEEWQGEMKRFRKMRKEGNLEVLECNNKTFTVGDDKKNKTLHFLVIQDTDSDKNPTIDPMGLAVKDHTFIVSGMIYAFKSKTNRDASFKYIMGLK